MPLYFAKFSNGLCRSLPATFGKNRNLILGSYVTAIAFVLHYRHRRAKASSEKSGRTVFFSPVESQKSSVYSWGSDRYFQTGQGTGKAVHSPTKVGFFDNLNVVKVVSNGYQSLALTRDGKLYTFGRGEGFRLGHGSEANELIPRSVSALENEVVTEVSAGEAHFAAVTKTGELWTWGRNSSGQLGRDWSTLPQKVPDMSGVRSVSCGESHTLALKADGAVFSCGNGRSAALGHGDRRPKDAFQKIAGLREKIAQIAAGEDFSLFLGRSGRVYACGASDFGQTGLGQAERYCLEPRELCGLAEVGGVAAKGMHALAHASAAARQRVFAWGLNQDGQLGLGDTATRAVPSEIRALSKWLSDGWFVAAVETGAGHSAVILGNRGDGETKLFVFGSGRYGQIGNGRYGDGGAAEAVAAFKTEPVELRLPRGGRVVSVALGKEHSLCVCIDK